jgi:hypothetical protein
MNSCSMGTVRTQVKLTQAIDAGRIRRGFLHPPTCCTRWKHLSWLMRVQSILHCQRLLSSKGGLR